MASLKISGKSDKVLIDVYAAAPLKVNAAWWCCLVVLLAGVACWCCLLELLGVVAS